MLFTNNKYIHFQFSTSQELSCCLAAGPTESVVYHMQTTISLGFSYRTAQVLQRKEKLRYLIWSGGQGNRLVLTIYSDG